MFYSKKLKKIKNLNHCFFSRKSGFSKGIYKSLNCGPGSDDNKKDIKKNLKFVSNFMKIKKKNLILMQQTHSNKIIVINNKNKNKNKFKCDGLVTKIKNIGLGVLTADCVPIIFYDSKNQLIGVVHAGWKGAFTGILENVVKIFKKLGSKNEIFAAIGPCIDIKNYEVDSSFKKKFIKKSKKNSFFFKKKNNNKFLFDLRKFVINKLSYLGINKIENLNYNTFTNSRNFYSFRRSKSLGETDYGRCISVIALKND